MLPMWRLTVNDFMFVCTLESDLFLWLVVLISVIALIQPQSTPVHTGRCSPCKQQCLSGCLSGVVKRPIGKLSSFVGTLSIDTVWF